MELVDAKKTIPLELCRLELPALHTHIHRFIGYRITIFAATVGLIGTMLTLATDPSEMRSTLMHILIMAILLFSAQMLGGLSRAIWMFCLYGVVLERNLGGRGSLGRWIGLNSYDGRFSTTHSLYRGMRGLTMTASIVIAILQSYTPLQTIWIESHEISDSQLATSAIVLVIDLIFFMACMATCEKELTPRHIINDAIAHAHDIDRWIESLTIDPTAPNDRIPKQVQSYLRR